jgi:glycosyltransferase involved in cell wall biosynthesis
LKVFAYHNSNNGVSYYRTWQRVKWLKALGVVVKRLPDVLDKVRMPLDGDGGNVPGAESHAKVTEWADVLFSNFRIGRADTVRMKAQATMKPLVVDIDDDVDAIDQSNPAFKDWLAQPDAIVEVPDDVTDKEATDSHPGMTLLKVECQRFLVMARPSGQDNVKEQLRAAAAVTVSTPYLAEVYKPYNKNIHVIPNCIDFDLWGKVTPKDDGLIRIGLFGSNSHQKDWRESVDAIKRILAEYPNTRLMFNAWMVVTEAKPGANLYQLQRHFKFPDFFETAGLLNHPQVEICEPCEIQDYPKWLQGMQIDIGLAPLADTRFNKSKSNLKYIEFGAMGVPAVYADQEAYADVEHGVTGLKAGKPAEYYTQLKKLVESKELREKLGNAAHADVKARYSAQRGAEMMKAVFDSLKVTK